MASSIGIILVNKHLVTVCRFEYVVTMLCLNFLSVAVVMELLARLAWFEVKHIPDADRWFVSILAAATVVLNNASNEANSVGFFQIMKLMVVPTVMILQWCQGSKATYSSGLLVSLCIASLGVGIATVSDFQMNTRGTILSVVSIICMAHYQMRQSSKQHDYGVNAMQITHSVGWPQVAITGVAALVLDVLAPELKAWLLLKNSNGSLLYHNFRGVEDLFWISLCCLLSVAVNISVYCLLGKTTPVTYQVIGQFKTCLIVLLGYVLFDVHVPAMWLMIRLAGVGIAVFGIISYAVVKNNEHQKSVKTS